MKNGIIAVVVIAVVALLGYLAYAKFGPKPLISKGEFGHDTVVALKADTFNVACNDAKSLVVMIDTINKDFAEQPELTAGATDDNMTPAMKNFEKAMDNLGVAMEEKFKNDNETREKAFTGVGDGVAQIFQVAVFKELGMITEESLKEFIDVTFCGVAAKEGYVSPLEALNPPEGAAEGMPMEGAENSPEADMPMTTDNNTDNESTNTNAK